MKELILFLTLCIISVFAQKPMEPLDKTLFVFVHGTMDKWKGAEARGCYTDGLNIPSA